MFYENQSERQKLEYKNMLSIIGKLTRLFSDSDSPYLPYRVQENVFCKYFQADNISRSDCSADAKKNNIGIGLKTWVGSDDQKVAEFNRLRTTFAGLTGLELVRRISVLRNERIRVTKNLHGLTEMVYHIVKRIP
ncbi:MAG: NgoFVII family restriction endonuclease, partial [Clostridia bacterium]|nr:NgoFVII family restriction endonuclease [Clostridia bacterium]